MGCIFQYIGLKSETKELLDKLKIHPRQSYNEIILILAKEKELKNFEDGKSRE